DRPGHHQLSHRDSRRGGPGIPGARHAAAPPVPGPHAPRGTELPLAEPLVRRVPGRRDRPDRAGAQPTRRRVAGPDRPEDGVTVTDGTWGEIRFADRRREPKKNRHCRKYVGIVTLDSAQPAGRE